MGHCYCPSAAGVLEVWVIVTVQALLYLLVYGRWGHCYCPIVVILLMYGRFGLLLLSKRCHTIDVWEVGVIVTVEALAYCLM